MARSGTFPFLQKAAIEVADALTLESDPEAELVRERLLEIVRVMEGWRFKRPTDDERKSVIDELFDKIRRGQVISMRSRRS